MPIHQPRPHQASSSRLLSITSRLPHLAAVLVAGATISCSPATTTEEIGSSGTAATSVAAESATTEIVMSDFAFAIDGPLVPGGEIHTRNVGSEVHMFGMGKLADGKTLQDFNAAVAAGGSPPDFGGTMERDISLPGHTLMPGQDLRITVPELEAGEYVAGCFVLSEGDGMPHAAMGMAATVWVGSGTATPPTPDQAFTIERGAPVLGPTTVAPGPQHWRISAPGGAPGQQVALWRVDAGKTLDDSIGAFAQFMSSPQPSRGSGRGLSDDVVFVLHDFATAKETTLGVDLDPGTYVLTAFDPGSLSPDTPIVEQNTVVVR